MPPADHQGTLHSRSAQCHPLHQRCRQLTVRGPSHYQAISTTTAGVGRDDACLTQHQHAPSTKSHPPRPKTLMRVWQLLMPHKAGRRCTAAASWWAAACGPLAAAAPSCFAVQHLPTTASHHSKTLTLSHTRRRQCWLLPTVDTKTTIQAAHPASHCYPTHPCTCLIALHLLHSLTAQATAVSSQPGDCFVPPHAHAAKGCPYASCCHPQPTHA